MEHKHIKFDAAVQGDKEDPYAHLSAHALQLDVPVLSWNFPFEQLLHVEAPADTSMVYVKAHIGKSTQSMSEVDQEYERGHISICKCLHLST